MTTSANHEETPLAPPNRPLLLVLSGLSGVGKDTVLSRLKRSRHALDFVVTVTTRPRRPAERDGVHYHFVSDTEFREMINADKLLEYASVYGYYYGVPAEPVRESLRNGRDVIVKVDVQGASTIKKIVPEAVLIFLAVSSMEELASRLKMRSTESPSDLKLRLKTAEEELAKLPLFDYLVINRRGEVNRTVADINAVITAEKCRIVEGKVRS